jgi:hypothetical protein
VHLSDAALTGLKQPRHPLNHRPTLDKEVCLREMTHQPECGFDVFKLEEVPRERVHKPLDLD